MFSSGTPEMLLNTFASNLFQLPIVGPLIVFLLFGCLNSLHAARRKVTRFHRPSAFLSAGVITPDSTLIFMPFVHFVLKIFSFSTFQLLNLDADEAGAIPAEP